MKFLVTRTFQFKGKVYKVNEEVKGLDQKTLGQFIKVGLVKEVSQNEEKPVKKEDNDGLEEKVSQNEEKPKEQIKKDKPVKKEDNDGLEEKTKAQLNEIAKAEHIPNFNSLKTNAERVKAIRAHRAKKA